ncbi:deoxycytidyl transferase [Yamadazyma tenuis]|uniref:DNA repair protein REV1 n=1 Tax=Candida tenuis (strain ATCC 10573 / BCRC 21748 / CBS 615 / JCM 9827 / NBRC 10315 / NRRL Y-1498 / VKM Y-70) TaxID=590646 RepID=G3AY00_CANTC|nr:DNA repair protein [Yamadazyma tenuis ATCC 10573]EGV65736.1 DNA repair protein [Yamadazyma tenuis ATCC 10573]WEJ95947.1 deoxycytidyl transferase [Yamadazyma tenuis]
MDDEHNNPAQYRSFLKSLNDSQLLSHVSSLSQSQTHISTERVLPDTPSISGRNDIDASTPNESKFASSDPFADSFNDILLAQENHIPPAQLGEQDSDTSEDEEVSGIGPKHEFGQYDVYFQNKHDKQQLRDEAYRDWDLKRRGLQGQVAYQEPIFRGCTIYVNGYTVPSINEIHRLVIIYGGIFLPHLANKSSATHIVCDKLTPRKQQIFKNCKVVKAKWIVDSVEVGRLLDWKKYRLFQEVSYDQQRLDLKSDTFAIHQFNTEDIIDEDEQNILEDFYEAEQLNNAEQLDDEKVQLNGSRADEDGRTLEKTSIMTAKHPDFLPHFFANSRLHHLSSWKADLRAKFLKMVYQAGTSKVNMNSTRKMILHLDFDCFFATASAQKHPNLDIQKDAIVVSHGNDTSDIASCNYVARSFGIRNGMWIRSAKDLYPNICIIDYEFDLYEKYASELYNYLLSRSGDFDTIYPVSVDEALLDITSYASECEESDLQEHIIRLCTLIKSDIERLTKCTVSVGVGRNVLLAKLALQKSKPDGILFLNENVQEFLDDIPMRSLPRVGYSIIEKFQQEIQSLSEVKVSDLRKIAKSRLINVFGPKTGQKLYDYARGVDDSSIRLDSGTSPALLGRKSVSVDVNFGIRFDTTKEVEVFMANMAKEMSKRLVNLELVGSQVTLKLARRADNAPRNPPKYLGMGHCNFFNKSSKLGVASNEWGILAAEIKALSRILNIPPKELRGVAVTVSKLEDSETFKRGKQQKLSAGSIVRSKPKREIIPVDTSDFKDPMEGATDIDWDIFNALPWSIRKELRGEMTRRGIISRDSSPSKGHKVYLQQLLPSGTGSQTRYVRVLESPKKPRSRSATASPRKSSVTPAPEPDLSYDSAVLNELPSSVRDEVINGLEQRKRQKVNPQTLKSKFVEIAERDKEVNKVIDENWVLEQNMLRPPARFLDMRTMYSDIKVIISGWIAESFNQEGPHDDDVQAFVGYLKQLLAQANLARCIRSVDYIRREVNYYDAISRASQTPGISPGLMEWRRIIKTKFEPVLHDYCNKNTIKLVAKTCT